MTFLLSKLSWPFLQPVGLTLVLLIVGAVLSWTPWWRAGRRMVALAALLAAGLGVSPAGPYLLRHLEERFPQAAPAGPIDGIIVLGGGIDPRSSAAHDQPALTDAAERLTAAAALARRYPDAPLVYSGGSGLLLDPDAREAPAAAALLVSLGIDPGRIVLEDQSRDTFENAVLTRALIEPQAGERWLLVTSAFHMPRSVGAFAAAGWSVIPYPVDYRTHAASLRPGLGGPFAAAHLALHEWLGLIVYRLTGRTNTLFPGPEAAQPLAPTGAAMAQQAARSPPSRK